MLAVFLYMSILCMPTAAKVRIFQASYANERVKFGCLSFLSPLQIQGVFMFFSRVFLLDHLIVALMVLNILHFYMIRYNLSCVGRNHNHWSVDMFPQDITSPHCCC